MTFSLETCVREALAKVQDDVVFFSSGSWHKKKGEKYPAIFYNLSHGFSKRTVFVTSSAHSKRAVEDGMREQEYEKWMFKVYWESVAATTRGFDAEVIVLDGFDFGNAFGHYTLIPFLERQHTKVYSLIEYMPRQCDKRRCRYGVCPRTAVVDVTTCALYRPIDVEPCRPHVRVTGAICLSWGEMPASPPATVPPDPAVARAIANSRRPESTSATAHADRDNTDDAAPCRM